MTHADMLIRKCTDHVTDGSAKLANRTHLRTLFTRNLDFPWASRDSVDLLASVSFFLVESEPRPPQVQEQRGPRIVVQARMPEGRPCIELALHPPAASLPHPRRHELIQRRFARIQSAGPTDY